MRSHTRHAMRRKRYTLKLTIGSFKIELELLMEPP